jgi:hypothetical protein
MNETMINAQSQSILLDILRRESRSLLIYIGEAYPWTADESSPALPTLRRVIRQESDAIAAVGRFLVRHRVVPPPLGPYPMDFTSWNFIDLTYLLPRLIESQRQAITRLEADLPQLSEETRPVASTLLGVKRKSLAALEQLTAPQPEPATV